MNFRLFFIIFFVLNALITFPIYAGDEDEISNSINYEGKAITICFLSLGDRWFAVRLPNQDWLNSETQPNIQGNLLLIPEVLGAESSRYLGFTIHNDNILELPTYQKLQQILNKTDRGKRFHFSDHQAVENLPYLELLADGKMPIASPSPHGKGRVRSFLFFTHDLSSHFLWQLIMPKDLLNFISERTRRHVDFFSHVKNKYSQDKMKLRAINLMIDYLVNQLDIVHGTVSIRFIPNFLDNKKLEDDIEKYLHPVLRGENLRQSFEVFLKTVLEIAFEHDPVSFLFGAKNRIALQKDIEEFAQNLEDSDIPTPNFENFRGKLIDEMQIIRVQLEELQMRRSMATELNELGLRNQNQLVHALERAAGYHQEPLPNLPPMSFVDLFVFSNTFPKFFDRQEFIN